MKEIQLTKGYVALVDDEDFERVNAKKWHAWVGSRKHIYASRSEKDSQGKYKTLMMHSFIMVKTDGSTIDHKNHNGLDNQRDNLRLADMSQQNANKRMGQNLSSCFKGVRRRGFGRWYSRIKYRGEAILLGKFETEIEAAQAYNIKAIELFGEFALLNKI